MLEILFRNETGKKEKKIAPSENCENCENTQRESQNENEST